MIVSPGLTVQVRQEGAKESELPVCLDCPLFTIQFHCLLFDYHGRDSCQDEMKGKPKTGRRKTIYGDEY